MSSSIQRDPTEFFTVVGAAYVPEHHLDAKRQYLDGRSLKAGRRFPWIVGLVSVLAISTLADIGFAQWIAPLCSLVK